MTQINSEMLSIKGAMDELKTLLKYLNPSYNTVLGEKATQSYQMHNTIVVNITEAFTLIETIKAQVFDNLSLWKRHQQKHRLGIGPKADLDELYRIQSSYEELFQTLWDMKTILVKLADIHR